jgi:hypothetical protein
VGKSYIRDPFISSPIVIDSIQQIKQSHIQKTGENPKEIVDLAGGNNMLYLGLALNDCSSLNDNITVGYHYRPSLNIDFPFSHKEHFPESKTPLSTVFQPLKIFSDTQSPKEGVIPLNSIRCANVTIRRRKKPPKSPEPNPTSFDVSMPLPDRLDLLSSTTTEHAALRAQRPCNQISR